MHSILWLIITAVNLELDNIDKFVPHHHKFAVTIIDKWYPSLLYDTGSVGLLSHKNQLKLWFNYRQGHSVTRTNKQSCIFLVLKENRKGFEHKDSRKRYWKWLNWCFVFEYLFLNFDNKYFIVFV